MQTTNKLQFFTKCALLSALMCLFAPMSIPIGPIPISLTNFVIYLSIIIIGAKGTLVSFIVYFLIGLAGLPVYSGFCGGPAKVAGPTGGFLVGFLPMILVALLINCLTKGIKNKIVQIIPLFIGTIIDYLMGTMWYTYITDTSISAALTVCVYPFILIDILKMMLAVVLGSQIKKILDKNTGA